MIADIDDAVRSLVRAEAIDSSGVEVVFDAPTKDWAARRNAPTVDIYLYDIREDLRRRAAGWVATRNGEGRIEARRSVPRYYKLSYLVTAWTQRPEDEHRLLADLLRSFLRYDAIPGELLGGELADSTLPVPLTVGLPPPEDRAFADVWSALGGELKPSLDLVISAPIDVGRAAPAGPPVLETPRLDLGDVHTGAEDLDRYRHTPGEPARPARAGLEGDRSPQRGPDAPAAPVPRARRRRRS
ncbi:MAG: DUF4255 domain-containing protein [Intrasporangium sp.]|uniref:DUF4255 domain-containing protein n=1 Tax=Intrasporangium sp. TaxID=1925024 RepID=UPI0026482743|nr:DUF4255 domain-containing protein [Intrasporangium sp.]MDN5796625.1 DUF4255 domain-containing protein [Intrasporangium sp.]